MIDIDCLRLVLNCDQVPSPVLRDVGILAILRQWCDFLSQGFYSFFYLNALKCAGLTVTISNLEIKVKPPVLKHVEKPFRTKLYNS